MTTNGRLADVQGDILKTPATNSGFTREQTLAKIWATTEMRTQQPFNFGGYYSINRGR